MSVAAIFEWAGASAGLVGAALLVANTRASQYGWFGFLLANFCMIAFAIDGEHWDLLTQQVGFTATSLFGLWRTGLLRIARAATEGVV